MIYFDIYIKIIIITVMFILSVIIRSYLLVRYKWVGSDSFYNFIVAKEIRKNKSLPNTIKIFKIPEEYDYPPFLHILLSFFDDKFYQKLQYLSPICDLIIGIIILYISFILFNIDIAIIATSIYFFTPMSFDISYSLTARTFGNLFLVIAISSLIIFFIHGIYIAIIISIIFSILVLITHRLTTQSLVFCLIIFSIGLHSVIPIFIIIVSIIFSMVVTKGFYLKVIKGHFDFVKVLGSRLFNPKSRSELHNILPSPVEIIFNMPIIILLPVLFLTICQNNIRYFDIWGISLVILSFIWIFGQGIRHLSNSIPAFAICIAVWTVQSEQIIISILIIFISLLFLLIKIYRMEKFRFLGNIITKDMLSAFEYIKTNKQDNDLLLCLPLNFSYSAAYFTDCIVLQSGGGFAKGLDINYSLYRLVEEGRINELIAQYNVNWVITLKKYSNMELGEIVFNQGDIKVIKIT
jgi:hypothetical protein